MATSVLRFPVAYYTEYKSRFPVGLRIALPETRNNARPFRLHRSNTRLILENTGTWSNKMSHHIQRPPSYLAILILSTSITFIGCQPPSSGRYEVRTFPTPDGSVTRLVDTATNTELVYITDSVDKGPIIGVLPESRRDIRSVAVGSWGERETMVWFKDEGRRRIHSVTVSEDWRPATMNSTDRDGDGRTDLRMVRFPTNVGHIEYFDFDANGILDAYAHTSAGTEEVAAPAILVEGRWTEVTSPESFSEESPTAKGADGDGAVYAFKESAWKIRSRNESN